MKKEFTGEMYGRSYRIIMIDDSKAKKRMIDYYLNLSLISILERFSNKWGYGEEGSDTRISFKASLFEEREFFGLYQDMKNDQVLISSEIYFPEMGQIDNFKEYDDSVEAYLTYDELYVALLEKVEFCYYDYRRKGIDLVPYLAKVKVAFFGGDEAVITRELEKHMINVPDMNKLSSWEAISDFDELVEQLRLRGVADIYSDGVPGGETFDAGETLRITLRSGLQFGIQLTEEDTQEEREDLVAKLATVLYGSNSQKRIEKIGKSQQAKVKRDLRQRAKKLNYRR